MDAMWRRFGAEFGDVLTPISTLHLSFKRSDNEPSIIRLNDRNAVVCFYFGRVAGFARFGSAGLAAI